MTFGPSNRALFECGLIVGLIVACVAVALVATRPAPKPQLEAAYVVAGVRADVERMYDVKPTFIEVTDIEGDTATIDLSVDGYMPPHSKYLVKMRYGWSVGHVEDPPEPAPRP